MKKICFVLKDVNLIGGAERSTLNVADALKDVYEVHLITLHLSEGRTLEELPDSICVHVIDEHPFTRIRNTYRICRKEYRKILCQENFDDVILETTYVNFLGCIMGIGLHVPTIVCDHGAIESQLNDYSITFLRRIAAKMAYKIVVLTDSSMRAYQTIFHTPKKKLVKIGNWISPDLLEKQREYHAESRRIITAGRFTKEKCFQTIVPIAQRVFKECPGWQWDIYGKGEEFPLVEKQIKEAGLEDSIHLMGERQDLSEIYPAYAFYVLTSDREGLPMVLLEAKAIGLPIISYDVITGPSEIVDDGVNGFLVKNQDQNAMAEKIIQLMKDPALRISFASHAHDHIQKFEKSTIVSKWRELLQ
jgi:glycosyltransferase involved in cell wall biosynthesis